MRATQSKVPHCNAQRTAKQSKTDDSRCVEHSVVCRVELKRCSKLALEPVRVALVAPVEGTEVARVRQLSVHAWIPGGCVRLQTLGRVSLMRAIKQPCWWLRATVNAEMSAIVSCTTTTDTVFVVDQYG